MAAPARTRADIDRRRRSDSKGESWPSLATRIGAVVTAERALERRETGAAWALRSALVDLAAAAEQRAALMPAPKRR